MSAGESRSNFKRAILAAAIALGVNIAFPAAALAHCDGMDGPVVKAARAALDARNPALVLIWVRAEDEAEVRDAFEQALAVREVMPKVKERIDRFFFETVVRLHREGEGVPYTGLKPPGRDLGPAIPAADVALDRGSLQPVTQLLTEAMLSRLRERFTEAAAAKRFRPDDVAAGREYVKAYVEFIHYVERVYEATATAPHGHFQ